MTHEGMRNQSPITNPIPTAKFNFNKYLNHICWEWKACKKLSIRKVKKSKLLNLSLWIRKHNFLKVKQE